MWVEENGEAVLGVRSFGLRVKNSRGGAEKQKMNVEEIVTWRVLLWWRVLRVCVCVCVCVCVSNKTNRFRACVELCRPGLLACVCMCVCSL